MTIAFAYDKLIKHLKVKENKSDNVIVAKLKWDFFYTLFIEGMVDILASVAETIVLFVGEESED